MDSAQKQSTHTQALGVSSSQQRACACREHAASHGCVTRTAAAEAAEASPAPSWDPTQGRRTHKSARGHERTLSQSPAGTDARSALPAADTKEAQRSPSSAHACGPVRESVADHAPAGERVLDGRRDTFGSSTMLLPGEARSDGAAGTWRGGGDGGARRQRDAESAGMQGSAARGSAASLQDRHISQQPHTGGTHGQAEVSRGAQSSVLLPLHPRLPGGRERSPVEHPASVVPSFP